MSSNASHASPKVSLQEIQASSQHKVTPCVVIYVGTEAESRLKELRPQVESWLGESFPADAVTWGHATAREQITTDWATKLIEPLVAPELWFSLKDRGYVDQIPVGTALASVRVYILLYDPKEGICDLDFLMTIVDVLKTSAVDHANLQVSLVFLLDDGSWPVQVPRADVAGICVISREGSGGLIFEPERVYDVVRIVLPALIASEAGEVVLQFMDELREEPIIAIGASAVSTAVSHMRSYRASRIFDLLVQPYLGNLSVDRENEWRGRGAEVASRQIGDWSGVTLKVLAAQGWNPANPGKPDIVKVSPNVGSALDNEIADPSEEFTDVLYDVLAKFDHAFARQFEEERRAWTERALEELYEVSGLTGAHEIGGGLECVSHALQGFFEVIPFPALCTKGGQPIPPLYASDTEGWRKHAVAAACDARLKQVAFQRLVEATTRPLHVAIRLFPAWSLVGLLLQAFTAIPEWLAWTTAFLLVAFGGALGYLFWQRALRAKERNLRNERLKEVRRLVLGIAALYANIAQNAICDAAQLAYQEIAILAAHLTAMLARHTRQVEEIEGISALTRTRMPETALTEHLLFDLPRCDEWARQAVQLAASEYRQPDGSVGEKKLGKLYGDLLDTIEQTVKGRKSGMLAAGRMNEIASIIGDIELSAPQLAAIQLCDEDPEIKDREGGEGRRWNWLFSRAHPMGVGGDGPELTMIVLADEAALAGDAGRTSKGWNKEWLKACSRQPYRITCIRAVPLSAKCMLNPQENSAAATANVSTTPQE